MTSDRIESPFDSFWIEYDYRGDSPVLLSCRRCGVHHVIHDGGRHTEPPTLAYVIELARQHSEVDCG